MKRTHCDNCDAPVERLGAGTLSGTITIARELREGYEYVVDAKDFPDGLVWCGTRCLRAWLQKQLRKDERRGRGGE